MDNHNDEQASSAPPAWARRAAPKGAAPQRVTVVGPCAAGKTTLVAYLRTQGVDAYAVAQEHSGVRYLWQLAEPDLLIFLDVDLATTGQRRRRTWPATIYAQQQTRLAHARAHADLYLDSSPLTAAEVSAAVLAFITAQQRT